MKTEIIVIDDERTFEGADIHFRDCESAIDYVVNSSPDTFFNIWLDHDLGNAGDIMGFVSFLEELAYDRHSPIFPRIGAIFVHSQNPVGAANIVRALDRFYDIRRVGLPK